MPVCNQKTEPFTSLKYGAFSASYNACEAIAAYNALLLLGLKTVTIEAVISEFAERFLILSWLFKRKLKGLFGVWPKNAGKYLEEQGAMITKKSRKDNMDGLGEGSIIVCAVWKPLFRGIHTFTCLRTKDGWETYNRHSRNCPVIYSKFWDIKEKDIFIYIAQVNRK